MEILRSGFQSVLGAGGGGSAETPSPADTIEKLVDRLVSSTLLVSRLDLYFVINKRCIYNLFLIDRMIDVMHVGP